MNSEERRPLLDSKNEACCVYRASVGKLERKGNVELYLLVCQDSFDETVGAIGMKTKCFMRRFVHFL